MSLFLVCKTIGGVFKPAKSKVLEKYIFTLSDIKELLFSVLHTAFKRHQKWDIN